MICLLKQESRDSIPVQFSPAERLSVTCGNYQYGFTVLSSDPSKPLVSVKPITDSLVFNERNSC